MIHVFVALIVVMGILGLAGIIAYGLWRDSNSNAIESRKVELAKIAAGDQAHARDHIIKMAAIQAQTKVLMQADEYTVQALEAARRADQR
jgi:predicted negative regulator of RcsB-dependent stress response